MYEKDFGVEERFYQQVATLLNCAEHTYRKWPYRKRTRWNNREPGNGRFPPNGLVRMFGPNLIHVALITPRLGGQFNSQQGALDAIKKALEDQYGDGDVQP